jgi:hypoxanthine-guanine phosphoribosyltransferase
MEMSATETKLITFQGKEHVRRKICIENTIFEQVNYFYVGYNLTYKEEIYGKK